MYPADCIFFFVIDYTVELLRMLHVYFIELLPYVARILHHIDLGGAVYIFYIIYNNIASCDLPFTRYHRLLGKLH